MATMLDTVRALRSQLKLGSNSRVSTLVLDARTPAAESLVGDVAGALGSASRARQVVRGTAANHSGIADIFVDVIT